MTRTYLGWLLLIAMVCVGCIHPTAILIFFDIDLQVSRVGASGPARSSPADVIRTMEASAKVRDPDGRTVYRDPLFEIGFAAGDRSFSVLVVNIATEKICFRFDDARVASNFQTTKVPLRTFRPGDWRTMHLRTQADEDKIRAKGYQQVEKVCLAPGQKVRVPCYWKTQDFFPSGMMFNVAHEKHVAKLIPDGIGNWIKLQLPIEVAGRTDVFEFKMTATGSHARPTYY